MNLREYTAISYALDRLGEPSTWQGIGFIGGLLGSHSMADMDWGVAAAIGGAISAVIKMCLPDPKGTT